MRDSIPMPSARNRPAPILWCVAFLLICTASGTAQTIGDSAALQSWIRCSLDTYRSERAIKTFDKKALEASWATCKQLRDAVLATVSAEQHAVVGRMLEGVHDSLIAELIAAENQYEGYGLSRNEPVTVGGGWQEGVARAVRYLAELRGPAGQRPVFVRVGSCCAFDTPNAPKGRQGRLEVYDVSYSGRSESVIVYFNTYDEEAVGIVKGFIKAPGPGLSEDDHAPDPPTHVESSY